MSLDTRKVKEGQIPEDESHLKAYRLGRRRILSAMVDPAAWEEIFAVESHFALKVQQALNLGRKRIERNGLPTASNSKRFCLD